MLNYLQYCLVHLLHGFVSLTDSQFLSCVCVCVCVCARACVCACMHVFDEVAGMVDNSCKPLKLHCDPLGFQQPSFKPSLTP